MLKSHKAVAFSATQCPDEARAFYADVLGLQFIADEPFALVFDMCGTMLRIQKTSNHVALPYTSLGWDVPDIAAMVRALRGKGVVFERFDGFEQDDLAIWVAPGGTRVAWFRDPDGNLLSLSQFA
jgi:catechol 2,3-dioxygenase-like lactoylglutathione lyase family enzyme